MNNKTFYMALIMDSEYIFQWQLVAIKNILSNDKNKLRSIILNKKKPIGAKKFFKGNLSKNLLMFNRGVVKHISKLPILRSNIGLFTDALKLSNIRELVNGEDIDFINLDYYIAESKFQDNDIDFMIDFSNLNSYEHLINSVNYGIFSYSHGMLVGNNNPYSCAYYEALFKIEVTPFQLKYYSKQIKACIIVYREYIDTHILPVCNTNNISWASTIVLGDEIELLRKFSEDYYINSRKNKYCEKDEIVLNKINNLKLAILNFNSYLRYLIKTIEDRLLHYQWFLLLVNNSDGEMLDKREKQIRVVPELDRFWADPSIVVCENGIYLFVEEELRSNKKGHISVVKLNKQGEVEKVTPIMVEGYHMSYPYIISHNDEYYMIPESSQNNSIKLYKAEKFPYEWKEIKSIMNDVKGIDTSVVFFNGFWWMFLGKYSSDNSQNRKLYLYYSDNLVEGNWVSHPQNPVVSDIREARNAGKIFEHNGSLYRPAQDCSKGYGYGIRVKKIARLSKDEYSEEEVHNLNAGMFTQILGMHTINQDKDILIMDMLRRVPKFLNKSNNIINFNSKNITMFNIEKL